MPEYIDRNALIEHMKKDPLFDLVEQHGVTDVIESFPAADVVSKAAYDQVAWERNLAEEQLKSIGKSLGEKMDDVQPVKHGRWMYCSIEDMFHCTRCDAAAVRNSFVYCPICGAKMDGENND